MAPISDNKNYQAPSVFQPSALLREARRQKNLPAVDVPPVCILDPDGDIVRRLRREGRSQPFPAWACYHTALDSFELAGETAGIVGCAVGASFAVLIAEELFTSGCKLLLSLTSAGQIEVLGTPPYFVVIDRALRDEGTSDHYAPPAEFAHADKALITTASAALAESGMQTFVGATWTTDAPFRETREAINWARTRGTVAVEMEAAALYTFAAVKKARVLCLAHVTNAMAQAGQDFEKGAADGTDDALTVLAAVAAKLRSGL
ncbi:nucleoside phosphorylase [Rhodoplanes sp. Z2-YC6860]|uniref:nucleoside phosphorylase n=1 Tax=Rhodoplanes sp. Z2-YC6860 TaxID=674703 RepID=UPI00078C78C2|nr:nucleoside phosphorylase [Rhodoplanes sp. Z2-YC6860]AMN42094.1 purine phosphorylase family 1 [Rhodoplanes sp. Z2-YC6860]